MAWAKNGSTDLSSAGDNITLSNLTASKTNMFLCHGYASGSNPVMAIQYNSDTGSNYARRGSTNGSADGTATSGTYAHLSGGGLDTGAGFVVGYILNVSSEEKLSMNFFTNGATIGAATVPDRGEYTGKWANTSDSITTINITNANTGDFGTNSNLSVLGSELTPASAKTIETGSIYIDTDINARWWYDGTNWNMQPTFEDNFSTDNWTDASTLIQVNTSTGVLDWDANSSSNQTSYRDIGRELSTSFVLRSKLVIDSISYSSSDSVQIYLGLFDSTSGANVAQDGFAFYIMADTSGSNGLKYRVRAEGAPSAIENTAGDAQFSRTPSAETLYLELVRNGTTFTINLYNNSSFSTASLLESKSATEANVTGLRYLAVKNYLRGGSGGTLNGTWDDVKIYDGVTSV